MSDALAAEPTTRPSPLPVPGGLPARRVGEALFPTADVRYVAAYDAIADTFDTLDDQRPATCGAYATRYLLTPLGFAEHDGIPTLREDYLALLAGTAIEAWEVDEADRIRAEIAAAGLTDEAAITRYPRAYYRWPLSTSLVEAELGTSPAGSARAIAVASGGCLATLPVPARRSDGSIVLTETAFDALFDVLHDRLAEWGVHPLVNYEVDRLLAPTDPAYAAAGLTGPHPERLPLEQWGVGHFAGVGALWRAPDGRRWFLLLDSFKARGFQGYQPQPATLVRDGLVRADGREGGILLVVPREHLDTLRDAIEGLGLEVRMWGNGSLEPEGWTWQYGR
jgi:hypothetical protein